MPNDVPKAEALCLLEGVDIDGRPVKRWLDGVPSFEDTKTMVWMDVSWLRPIVLPTKGRSK